MRAKIEGWIVPPPHEPVKSAKQFQRERERKVRRLEQLGLLHSPQIREAMLKVCREDFIPFLYRDYAYEEVPLPLPGINATISCPHSYPLFYEPLDLDVGHRFLEIGLGSGYGTALAREIVGSAGLVVSVEIDLETFHFAQQNLERAGYDDVILVEGDGGLGWPERAPYDRICITAACDEIPPPLVEQLADGGKLIAPVRDESGEQYLTLLEKSKHWDVTLKVICSVLYVPLQGRFGNDL